jgi:hypothetical protein
MAGKQTCVVGSRSAYRDQNKNDLTSAGRCYHAKIIWDVNPRMAYNPIMTLYKISARTSKNTTINQDQKQARMA